MYLLQCIIDGITKWYAGQAVFTTNVQKAKRYTSLESVGEDAFQLEFVHPFYKFEIEELKNESA